MWFYLDIQWNPFIWVWQGEPRAKPTTVAINILLHFTVDANIYFQIHAKIVITINVAVMPSMGDQLSYQTNNHLLLYLPIQRGHWQSGEYSVYTNHRRATRSHQPFHKLTTWWRHQMETFSVLLAICAGNSPVTGEFPTQRPVTRSFGGFFDMRLNKRLSKQSWGWWFDTPSRLLWRHCNVYCSL